MEQLLAILGGAGNLALVGIAIAIYRVEVRLVKVETMLNCHLEEKD